MMGEGGTMDYINKLRDRAALAVFQFLLEHSDYGKEKWVHTDILADNAWELADRLMEKRGRPDKCRGCSLLKKATDEMTKELIASGRLSEGGAGPKSLRDSAGKEKPAAD